MGYIGTHRAKAIKGAWDFVVVGKPGQEKVRLDVPFVIFDKEPIRYTEIVETKDAAGVVVTHAIGDVVMGADGKPVHDSETVAAELYFSDLARDRSIQSVQFLGYSGDDYASLARGQGPLDANEIELEMEMDNYNPSRPRLKVKWINQIGFGKAPAASDDAIRALSMSIKGSVAKFDGTGRDLTKSKSSPNPNGGVVNNGPPQNLPSEGAKKFDDIPF